jgi:spore germination protein YaaH
MNMRKLSLFILGLIIVCALFFQGFKTLNREKQEPVPSTLPGKPKILVFYEEGWGGIYAGSWERLTKVKEKIDIVSPVWLSLKANGKVNWDKTNLKAIEFFDLNKLEFLILVTAGSGRNGSSILANPNHQRNAINSITAYLRKVDAAGICLDFEYLNPVFKEELVEFVTELKANLAGEKLLVAVFPYSDWDEPTKEVYDYKRLADISDGIIVMTYDQHRPKDPAGPVASIEWVEDNLRFFLTQIKAEKLWLGIAGYGYHWQTGKKQATALPAWYCRDKASQKGILDTYHSELGNDYLEYGEDGKFNMIWWESSRGMKEKLKLASENHLAGVALWRLGYEEEEFWETVSEFR